MINLYKKQFLIRLITALALFSAGIIFLTNIYNLVSISQGYPVALSVNIRIISIFVFVAMISIYVFKKEIYSRKDVALLSIVFLVILICAQILFLNKHNEKKVIISLVLIYGVSLLYLFSYQALDEWIKNLKGLLLSFLIVIVALTLPILTPNYLNHESSVNWEYIGYELKNNSAVNISLNKKDAEYFKLKSINISGKGLYKEYLPINIHENNGRIDLEIPIGPDLSSYCLFVVNERLKNDKNSLEECLKFLGQTSSSSIFEKTNYIRQSNSWTKEAKPAFLSVLEAYTSDRKLINFPLLELMLVRGNLFHHYSYILNDINKGWDSFVFNQYGFGPLYIVKIISDLFKIPTFDSLFWTISIINFIVFIILLLFYRKNPYVMSAYGFSIISVYAVSNIIAPFLYYIRYLPVIFMYLFLLNHPQGQKENFFTNILKYSIFVLIGIYNKELAILVMLSLLLTVIVFKSLVFFKYFLITLVAFCALTFLSNSNSGSEANFIAALSGVGIDGNFSLQAALFFSALFLSLILKNKIHEDFLKVPQNFFLTVCLFLLSIKVAWTGSGNHIGPLMLLTTIFFLDSNIKLNISNLYVIQRSSLIVILGLITVTSFIGFKSLGYFKQHSEVSYLKHELSHSFKIDSQLINKASELELFNKYKFFLISKQDDFLSVISQKELTGKFHNMSTNINYPVDVSKYLSYMSTFDAILVDKELINRRQVESKLTEIYNIDGKLNLYIRGYMGELNKLGYLADKSTHKYYKKAESKNFILFVKSE